MSSNSYRGGPASRCKSKKKKKKRGGAMKKMTTEQGAAFRSVTEWAFLGSQSSFPSSVDAAASFVVDEIGIQKSLGRGGQRLVFELHCHSKFSDGSFSPSKLVERAHSNGVKVLALTDHDTLEGIPQAVEAARRFNIKIIPGVEISTIFTSRSEPLWEEPVHILAYYSSCGPSRFEDLDKLLSDIRKGRFFRARSMVEKLNKLKLPVKWESVARIAGEGVAPGRLHVALAMVEAGLVENQKQAFDRYLFDGGPAYSTGREPSSEETIQLVHDTGGVSVLAHPWVLKNPTTIIRSLKEAGLHGLEVYRSNGCLSAYSDLADTYDLLKLGGSDFHGRGHCESELGSVNLPVIALHDFLQVARPIWCGAIRGSLESYANDPSDMNLARITRFGRIQAPKRGLDDISREEDLIKCCMNSWLTVDERQNVNIEAIQSKYSVISIH
ncbi:hypothetical protein SAY86_001379 [Trapa natans]|uniref:Polymerase/histidinol phosphatase N-terminal domain-containing protein n=1 Tax=Trapa natans TaxID=22666 RepID=A0AAN7RMC4_TRANT|nr:hypothetical protein SAY86_001379 [Trapa natans]